MAEIIQKSSSKMNNGAYRTSLDKAIVAELGMHISKEKPEVKVRSATSGGSVMRPGFDATLRIAGKTIPTVVSSMQREHLRFPVIVGRRDLDGFLIDPSFKVGK